MQSYALVHCEPRIFYYTQWCTISDKDLKVVPLQSASDLRSDYSPLSSACFSVAGSLRNELGNFESACWTFYPTIESDASPLLVWALIGDQLQKVIGRALFAICKVEDQIPPTKRNLMLSKELRKLKIATSFWKEEARKIRVAALALGGCCPDTYGIWGEVLVPPTQEGILLPQRSHIYKGYWSDEDSDFSENWL